MFVSFLFRSDWTLAASGRAYMKLRKIYLTQSRKGIANILIYLGALASLRENIQFLPRSDWTLAASGRRSCRIFFFCRWTSALPPAFAVAVTAVRFKHCARLIRVHIQTVLKSSAQILQLSRQTHQNAPALSARLVP